MKRLALIFPLAVVAVVSLSSLTPAANAVENETFGLTTQPERVDGADRRSFSIPLEPGATFEDSVRVYNRTDQPIELVVYAADAEASLDGTIAVGLRSDERRGVGAWIDLDEDEISLAPRASMEIRFTVEVRSADPLPDLGAIVAENTGSGLATDAEERLRLIVRTAPPNTPTSSVRARPLLLRSPWIIVAIAGLLAALALVFVGTRRARRPKDAVIEEPSQPLLDDADVDEPVVASRPVIRRLGERELDMSSQTSEHPRFSGAAELLDHRPLIDDDLLVEVEPDEVEDPEVAFDDDDDFDDEDLPLAGSAMPRKTAPRKKPKAGSKPARKVVARTAKAKAKKPAKPKPKPKAAAKKKPAARRKVVRKPAARQPKADFIPLDDV